MHPKCINTLNSLNLCYAIKPHIYNRHFFKIPTVTQPSQSTYYFSVEYYRLDSEIPATRFIVRIPKPYWLPLSK